MVNKKKFLGGLNTLLALSFSILLGFSSNCYALTSTNDMTVELMQEIVTTINDNMSVYTYKQPNTVSSFKENANYSNLVDSFKSNIDDAQFKTTYLEQLCITYTYDYGMNVILFIPNNSGIGNELNYLKFRNGSDTKSIDGGADILYMRMNADGTYNFGYWGTSCNLYTTQSVTFTNNTVANIPGFYSLYRPSEISYLPIGGSDWYWILTSTDNTLGYIEPSPEVPSGENPTIGNVGDITNNSGDTTGNVNLQPIVNSIDNVTNTLHNDNQQIINVISGESEKIINSITDSSSDITSGDFEDNFNDMLSSTANVVDPTTNFFSWLIDNIRSVLNSTGNYNITIDLFENTYTIRSDFFTLPDGDLKDFLQMSFIAWFGWRIIKKIRYIVYAIQCVNITSALDNSDFNANII